VTDTRIGSLVVEVGEAASTADTEARIGSLLTEVAVLAAAAELQAWLGSVILEVAVLDTGIRGGERRQALRYMTQ